jgi:carboxylesterase type B
MTYNQIHNVPYYDKSTIIPSAMEHNLSPYCAERCKLDLYYPEQCKNFATLIWFHGGGMTEGEKYLPKSLMNQGIAVVTPNYRLSGSRAKCPDYIENVWSPGRRLR